MDGAGSKRFCFSHSVDLSSEFFEKERQSSNSVFTGTLLLMKG